MIELWKPDPLLRRVLPRQSVMTGRIYRRSQYAFPFEADGRSCLFHTLTRQCYDLEGLDLSAGPLTGEELSGSAELSRLAEGMFFVPVEADEDARYEDVIRLLRALKRGGGRDSFTILTTTACNARCVYCFEEGLTPVTMSRETTDKALEFICNTRRKDAVMHLNWFGGEPLLATHVIDRIVTGLAERNIGFKSSMITNGSLIDNSLAEKMAGLWRIRRIQLSMDGDEETYIRRKNYLKYRDTYHRVIDAADDLARRDISVKIRINVDWENLDHVDGLIDDLDRQIRSRENVSIYLQPLYDCWRCEDFPKLWERISEYHVALEQRGYSAASNIKPRRLKLGRCQADTSPKTYAVIAPDGLLYACQHCVPGTAWGSLFDGVWDQAKLDSMARLAPVRDACRGCTMLPECTTTTQCPITMARCKETRRVQMLWALRREAAHLNDHNAAYEEDDD